MHRLATALACLSIPALLLTSCLEPSEPEPIEKVWYGLLSNSCGPRDEPVISVVLDTVAYADCRGEHHAGQYAFSSDVYPSVDGIVIGKVLDYEVNGSCGGRGSSCGDRTEYHLKVERMDATRVQAAFQIKAVVKGKSTVRSGTVVLTKCRERPNCG